MTHYQEVVMKKTLAIIILLLTVGCTLLQPSPDLAWDQDAEELIIRLTDGGGYQPEAGIYNEIPRMLVWGNGRIIWHTFNEDDNRQVWQAQLSEAEMTDLLQTFADKGFFHLDAHYELGEKISDSSSINLQINLLSGSYGVDEYSSGAPNEFHALVELLGSGAGAEGTPYIPQSGHLTAVLLRPRGGISTLPTWDAATLGLNLEDATGIWVDGDVLAYAWEIVNLEYWVAQVVQGEDLYELYVQLPELTGVDPK
ncbi:hypothetical protein MNBD_CHLOROFLEXI01-2421 [hydrothermal vent metagenome]|uniref:DUF6438 domain-containing protein n=1 Tax=hydrothermal vent metagenome TaxID=652676 RepID=A0A3B0UK29_9ZZZZ